MFSTTCELCGLLVSVDRPSRSYCGVSKTSLIVFLLVVVLSGGTISNRFNTKKNITSFNDKDIYKKDDNFRTWKRRWKHHDDNDVKNADQNERPSGNNASSTSKVNLMPTYNDLISNNHRKSSFDRSSSNVFEKQHDGTDQLDNYPATKDSDSIEFSSSWAIRLPKHLHSNSVEYIGDIVKETGLINHGMIGHLDGYFLLVHHTFYNHTSNINNNTLRLFRDSVTRNLQAHPHIEWVRHEIILKRKKRALEFKDEFFPSQWHLDNLKFVGHDINVTGVWEHHITGKGVTVSVIDDGVEWSNPDIFLNYSPEGSWDLNSNDGDPMPRVDDAGLNHHGTRCAGEIAAVANEFCAVGVAFGAKVSGIRILDGPMTDSLEAMAFNTKSNVNDVYSCSWGPDDNGRTVDGPHQMAQAALAHGVANGRHGFGSIFVVASGNGGHFKDNCNFDGYANSIFTVTIGAVDELGQMPYYAEQCAAMLAVTYSSGQGHQRNIVTTDWRLGSGTGCTDRHTGTSAAAPLAAGIIALMLEARPCLTWRDIQHIIVYTSVRVDIDPEEWQVNGAGLAHSHKHGFGLLDSWRLVTTSKMWSNVPFLTSWTSELMKTDDRIPILPGYNLTKTIQVTNKMADQVVTIEHVTVIVNIRHPIRGALTVKLISPSGTVSRLASKRKYDKSKEGFNDWTFSTVRCWGEKPQGTWELVTTDEGDGNHEEGMLTSWELSLYGSSMTQEEIQERRKLVNKAISGQFLHKAGPVCPLSPITKEKSDVVSPKVLKIILLLSGFFFLVGLYYVVETLCNHSRRESGVNEEGDSANTTEVSFDRPETKCTIDMTNPGDFSGMDSFVSDILTKDDEERLTNIIEHGRVRPTAPSLSTFSMTDTASLEILNITNPVSTPDDSIRVKEFEDRMKFAMEQSLKLQQVQLNQIDNLQKEYEQLFDGQTSDMFSLDTQSSTIKKTNKPKKLKGILKKPKQYNE